MLSVLGGLGGIVLGRWLLELLSSLIPAGLPRAADIAHERPRARDVARRSRSSPACSSACGRRCRRRLRVPLRHAQGREPRRRRIAAPHPLRVRAHRRRVRAGARAARHGRALHAQLRAALRRRSRLPHRSPRDGAPVDAAAERSDDGAVHARISSGCRSSSARAKCCSRCRASPPPAGSRGCRSAARAASAPFLARRTAAGNRARRTSSDPLQASPGYFDAMGITLIAGRNFTDQRQRQTAPPVVDRERFVRRAAIFPGQDPVGRRIRPGGPTSTAPWIEIVGVVSDVRTVQLEAEPTPQMYRCLWQASNLHDGARGADDRRSGADSRRPLRDGDQESRSPTCRCSTCSR